MIDIEKAKTNSLKKLDQNRAVSTLGIFARVRIGAKVLVIKRQEEGSLFNEDLRGKYEIPGGGVEVFDFEEEYQSAIILALERELLEEAGLQLIPEKLGDIKLIPAWLGKDGVIDAAFVIDVPECAVKKTKKFRQLIKDKLIQWITYQDLRELNFVSKRMRFMVLNGLI